VKPLRGKKGRSNLQERNVTGVHIEEGRLMNRGAFEIHQRRFLTTKKTTRYVIEIVLQKSSPRKKESEGEFRIREAVEYE